MHVCGEDGPIPMREIPELPRPEIKSLWKRLFHGDTPTHNRQFLERRIAYKLQEIEFRKVDPNLLDRNKRRIESLIETCKVIGIGGSHYRLHPCHTTRHAGPHRAVREVEVMRAGVLRVGRNTQWSIRC